MNPADWTLLRPWWVLALLPAAWLGWRLWRLARSGDAWRRIVDPQLLDALLLGEHADGSRRVAWAWIGGWLLALAALVGPAWERLPLPAERPDDALVVVLDVSLSMHATDLPPSRLVRARQKIRDLLALRRDGFTALVAVAGDAHVVTPLTDDVATIENLLPAVAPEVMPVLGSRMDLGIDRAVELLAAQPGASARILLVTDELNDPLLIADALPAGIGLSILAVGTADGARIPLDFAGRPGQFVRDPRGLEVIARVDEARMRADAGAIGARFAMLAVDDRDLAQLLPPPAPGGGAQERRNVPQWADHGHWLLVLLVPLVLLMFRRGVLVALVLVALPPPAEALDWAGLWSRPDQQAHDEFLSGQPERAAARFEDPAWQAAARYRAGDFAGAAALWDARPDLASRYNRANAAARGGDLERALQGYEAVLAEDPAHADAAANRDLVRQLLEQQQEQGKGQGDDPPGSDGDSADAPATAGEGQENDQPEQGGQPQGEPPQARPDGGAEQAPSGEDKDQPSEGANPDDPQGSQEPATAEERDALAREQAAAREQWLRRVPDDPGGLLRRKFDYESQLRRQAGEPRRDRDTPIW